MTDPARDIDLEAVLDEALRALTVLDADAIEGLADFLEDNSGRLELPRSTAEWRRLSPRLWVLGNLLDGTGRRIAMLRRLSSVPGPVGSYDGPGGGLVRRAVPLAALGRDAKGDSFGIHLAGAKAAN